MDKKLNIQNIAKIITKYKMPYSSAGGTKHMIDVSLLMDKISELK